MTEIPDAAARWLGRAVPPGKQTPEWVQVRQRGTMDAESRWLKLRATAEFARAPFAYRWHARLTVLPLLWVVADDGHDGDTGWGGARLMGLKTITDRRGPELLDSQLIRSIAELVLAPDLARGVDALRWSEATGVAAGLDAFTISADARSGAATVRFDVDRNDDVVRAWCADRPLDSPDDPDRPDGREASPWRCDFASHREFEGVRIPTSMVATYEFEDDAWQYLRIEVDGVKRS